jgi:isoleucyl-tRNA synthetase
MEGTRSIATEALHLRSGTGFKVKQPLAELKIKDVGVSPSTQNAVFAIPSATVTAIKNNDSLLELIKEEANVKKVSFYDQLEKNMELDTKLTDELKEEGILREIARQIQQIRKEAGLTPKDEILVKFNGSEMLNRILEKNRESLSKDVIAKILEQADEDPGIKLQKKVKINGDELWLGVEVNKK